MASSACDLLSQMVSRSGDVKGETVFCRSRLDGRHVGHFPPMKQRFTDRFPPQVISQSTRLRIPFCSSTIDVSLADFLRVRIGHEKYPKCPILAAARS